MKKILSLFLALCLLFTLAACGGGNDTPNNPTDNPGDAQTETPAGNDQTNPPDDTKTEAPEGPGDDTPVDPGKGGPTDLYYISEVTALEGEWKLSQVFVGGETADAAEGAMSLKITLELDPSELVDGPAYIHNQVYNLSGVLSFGLDSIKAQLDAEDVDSYKGTTSWEDFPQGKVVDEGEFYKQPGPATMTFKDIDILGLFLDEIAGIGGDVDTTANKKLIIGMNASGQLLLGYSEEPLQRPGTDGEWEYLLIFNK